MKKTFEISSYGVEEMNQQELLMVDGGELPSLAEVASYLKIKGGLAFTILGVLYDFFTKSDAKGVELQLKMKDFIHTTFDKTQIILADSIGNGVINISVFGVGNSVTVCYGDTTRNHK